MAAQALHEAAKANYASTKQIAIGVAQVHATLEVAHQLELLRTERLRVGNRGLFDDMHLCADQDGNRPAVATRWVIDQVTPEGSPPQPNLPRLSE